MLVIKPRSLYTLDNHSAHWAISSNFMCMDKVGFDLHYRCRGTDRRGSPSWMLMFLRVSHHRILEQGSAVLTSLLRRTNQLNNNMEAKQKANRKPTWFQPPAS